MKPDLEDFEDLNDEADAPRSRTMSWLVLAVAVAGFASLAYYAYHSGSEAAKEGEMMLVAADAAPMKTAPANPGGEEFANKDKTIYDVISPVGSGEKQVEKLLPEPQHPVMNNAGADHEDDDVDGVAQATKPLTPELSAAAAPDSPKTAGAPPTVVAAPAVTTTFVSKNLAPVGEDTGNQMHPANKPEVKVPGEPHMVNEKSATAKKIENPVSGKVAQPKATHAKKMESASGNYQLQLGAYASQGEADGAWKKISGAHADVLGGSPKIVKAEVNGKTYYRLRTGSFANASDAKAACAKLGGQACIPVK